MRTTVTQNYFGRQAVMFTNSMDELFAREMLARNYGLEKVPEADIDVTEKTEKKLFSRFTYNDLCMPFVDIINSIVKKDENHLYINVGNEKEECVVPLDTDAESYIRKFYSSELRSKLDGNDVAGNPEGRNSISNTIPEVAKMHIGENFMQKPTPSSPVNPITKSKSAKVNPMDLLQKRLDASTNTSITKNATLYSTYPFLKQLEDKIKSDGVLTVDFELANGIIKVNVSSVEKPDEVIDKYSFTLDLNGYIVTPGSKWWPGVEHDTPVDFKPAYKYDMKAIEAYLAGEEIPEAFMVYSDTVGELNKIVDLRSIFAVKNMTEANAKIVMSNIQESVKKLSTRLEKECAGMRFSVDLSTYTDRDNFELITLENSYSHVGGEVLNTGAAVRIQIASKKAPKLLK